jgi:hypothetical protein
MKDVDKRARQTVALGGLIMLLHEYSRNSSHSVTRNHLFAVPVGEEGDPYLTKAIHSRGWQKPYVKRLVSAKILSVKHAESQETYYPSDVDKLLELIEDHKEPNYGLRLAQFIFPNEAGLPVELRDHGQDEEPGEEVEAPSERDVPSKTYRITSSEVVNLISALDRMTKEIGVDKGVIKTRLQQDSEVLLHLRNRMKELDKRLLPLEQAVSQSYQILKRVESGTDSLLATINVVQTKLELCGADHIATAITSAVNASFGFASGTTLATFMRAAIKRFDSQRGKGALAERAIAAADDLKAAVDLFLQTSEEE